MNAVDWESVRAFVAVARHGAMAAAAHELGCAVSTIMRRVDGLEAQMGVRLLVRRNHGTKLTAAGEQVLALAQQGATHFDQLGRLAQLLAEGARQRPIRITATEPVIADILVPALPALYRQRPEVQLELETSNAIANLAVGAADIAIRLAEPKDETLLVRRLPLIAMGLFCHDSYLAGRPPEALDLTQERLLWVDRGFGPIPENRWLLTHSLQDRVRLNAGSVNALARAAALGLGIAPLPRYLARRHALTEVPFTGFPQRAVWLAFHRDSQRDTTMRAVRRWIVGAFEALEQ